MSRLCQWKIHRDSGDSVESGKPAANDALNGMFSNLPFRQKSAQETIDTSL